METVDDSAAACLGHGGAGSNGDRRMRWKPLAAEHVRSPRHSVDSLAVEVTAAAPTVSTAAEWA
jgi:hypothetical protein